MRFLNTNDSCVHTHTHTLAHKRIYTYKPSMLFTRTFSQQRGSGVFSFHPTHAILVSHTVQQTKTIICMHAQGQIHTFSHANLPFIFVSDTHRHYFSCTWRKKCTKTHAPDKHIQNHNGPSPGRWCTLCLISLLVERKQGGLGQAGLKICCMQLWPPLWKLVFYVPTVLFWTATALWQGQSHCYHCNTL